MLIDNISVVMIAKNAAKTIDATLKSLNNFSEIILYLNNSTDDTKQIAEKFDNVKIIDGEFLGFGPTKNRAATYAKNEWILSLDADEVVSKELYSAIKNSTLETNTLYSIKRINFYKDREVKHSGWGQEKIIRVYNKTDTSFNDSLVHEKIIRDGFKIELLSGSLKHYSFSGISDFIQKMDYYSTIYANENRDKKSSSPIKALFNAFFHFFKCYIFKRGFLDGYAGLLICVSGTNGVFYKYLKLYEENRKI